MGSRDSLTMNTKMKEGYMQFQCVGKCDMHFTSTVCVVKAKQKKSLYFTSCRPERLFGVIQMQQSGHDQQVLHNEMNFSLCNFLYTLKVLYSAESLYKREPALYIA